MTSPSESIQLRDDRGRLHRWASPPERVVSLVPSDTYSIIRLGEGHRLVGRTRYCVEPAGEVESIAVVGGTKDADVAAMIALAPDVVIANQEENTRRDIEALEEAGVRVLVGFPKRVADGIAGLARLARLFGRVEEGSPRKALVRAAYHAHRELELARDELRPVRAFVPIWMDPLMTVNEQTFISDMLSLVGAENVFGDRERRYPLAADLGDAAPLSAERVGDRDRRYPRVTLDEVVARDPELILLPSEPHPFSEADAEVFRALPIAAARAQQIHLCDGRDLMWYGARSVEGLGRLRALVGDARAALKL